jgi:hypothetical protein
MILVITFSRPAELYREQTMRLQFAKGLGRFALSVAQDLLHGDFGVVVQDGPWKRV